MVGHTGERGLVPGLVLHVSCSLRTLAASGTLCGLESPAAEGCGVGGEIGEPRRLERCRGRGGLAETDVGLLPQCPIPLPSEDPGWRKSQQGLCFFVPSSRGLLLSHMLLLKLLCYPLLPSLPPSSLQCTHLTPLQTHGPIVSSAPFLALWFPDEAS